MTLRRIALATLAALTAGVAALLALAAAADTYGDPGAATLTALAAIWLSQGIRPLLTRRRHHQ